jgi:hypothetical protein
MSHWLSQRVQFSINQFGYLFFYTFLHPKVILFYKRKKCDRIISLTDHGERELNSIQIKSILTQDFWTCCYVPSPPGRWDMQIFPQNFVSNAVADSLGKSPLYFRHPKSHSIYQTAFFIRTQSSSVWSY